LTGFAALTGLAGLPDLLDFPDVAEEREVEVRAAVPRAGRRRSAWALFFGARAGLRAEVRDLVTRRDLAIEIVAEPRTRH